MLSRYRQASEGREKGKKELSYIDSKVKKGPFEGDHLVPPFSFYFKSLCILLLLFFLMTLYS